MCSTVQTSRCSLAVDLSISQNTKKSSSLQSRLLVDLLCADSFRILQNQQYFSALTDLAIVFDRYQQFFIIVYKLMQGKNVVRKLQLHAHAFGRSNLSFVNTTSRLFMLFTLLRPNFQFGCRIPGPFFLPLENPPLQMYLLQVQIPCSSSKRPFKKSPLYQIFFFKIWRVPFPFGILFLKFPSYLYQSVSILPFSKCPSFQYPSTLFAPSMAINTPLPFDLPSLKLPLQVPDIVIKMPDPSGLRPQLMVVPEQNLSSVTIMTVPSEILFKQHPLERSFQDKQVQADGCPCFTKKSLVQFLICLAMPGLIISLMTQNGTETGQQSSFWVKYSISPYLFLEIKTRSVLRFLG